MQNLISKEKQDWTRWNLSIPLVLFLLGTTSALYQSFPNLFLSENGLLASAQYIGGIVVLFLLVERVGLNDKKIHFALAILLILAGLMLDMIFI
ncbi:hypothetical protein [Paenisporosarcina cavernae]|uniref:EamA domain-containing protein n=1 Tax=Paenisporosarcina cavernae TaxID=2320858 RepID=A0A385YWN2_9BACL|nr:hypothetical protein [Paenisporosarcina cavernae]AYC30088.1 hypothetical protein D3873_09460 [Paenisporosarcina cavernae]